MPNFKPFDKDVQRFLQQVDRECQSKMEQLTEHVKAQLLVHRRIEDIELDEEDQGWSSFIRAYGIMYNRLIDLGIIKDVVLVGENNSKKYRKAQRNT